MTEEFKELLVGAFLSSQDLIKKTGATYSTNSSFKGINIPLIEIEKFEKCIVDELKKAGKIPTKTEFTVTSQLFKNDLYGLADDVLQENQFRVAIRNSLNTCWQRFVRLKEFCQIYIDLDTSVSSSYKKDFSKQVYELVALHNEFVDNGNKIAINGNDANYTEFLSLLMAINLIFPASHRDDLKKILGMISSSVHITGGPKLYDLAYAYRMPEHIVGLFGGTLLPFYDSIKEMQFSS